MSTQVTLQRNQHSVVKLHVLRKHIMRRLPTHKWSCQHTQFSVCEYLHGVYIVVAYSLLALCSLLYGGPEGHSLVVFAS